MTRSKNSKAKPKKRHHKNLEASLNEMDQDVENLVLSNTMPDKLVPAKEESDAQKISVANQVSNQKPKIDQDKQEKRKSYNPSFAIPVADPYSDRYPVDRPHAAVGIIFNFKEFEDISKWADRHGTEKDVERLHSMFLKMNINITADRILHNRTRGEVEKDLEKFVSDKELMEKSNALIIVFLTHGLEHDKIMARDDYFEFYKLMDLFIPQRLPEMATRPKFFLIQACRGTKIDQGSLITSAALIDHVDSAVALMPPVVKYPNGADFIVGLSAHHGHCSYRNDQGSWYIQEFCNVIERTDLQTQDIISILTQTNNAVAKRNSLSLDPKHDDKKQISSFYSTLTKSFYLKAEKSP